MEVYPFSSSSSARFLIIFLVVIAGILYETNAEIDNPASSVPEGYTAYPSINTAYKFFGERLTWSEAKSKCMLEGARLAVIDNHQKVRYIGELKHPGTYVWIGISRESRGSPWLTDDSSTIISYLPWAPREPSCFHNCIAVTGSCQGVSNENCNARKSFVCEVTLQNIGPRFNSEK